MKRWLAFVVAASVACGVGVRPVAPANLGKPTLAGSTFGQMKEDVLAPVTRLVARELAVRVVRATVKLGEPLLRAFDGDIAPARASLLARLGALSDDVAAERAHGRVSTDTVAALRELRIAYHPRCAPDCAHDAIFAELTKQLIAAYAGQGDRSSAMAERQLLATLQPTR